MEYAVIATPEDELGLRLDWKRFRYAGKFVMTNTGKAVVVEDGVLDDPAWPPEPADDHAPGVVAALAFNADRTRSDTAWLRYVTVRDSDRGNGIGPRLCGMTTEWLRTTAGYDRVRIAVNNPFAFDALHKAGFGWTGETSGIRECVLEAPPTGDRTTRYRDGLSHYLDGDVGDREREFVETRRDRGLPAGIEAPKGEDYTGPTGTSR